MLWATTPEKISNPTGIRPHVVTMVTLERNVTVFKEDRDKRKKCIQKYWIYCWTKAGRYCKRRRSYHKVYGGKKFKNLADEIQNKINDKIDSDLASISTNNSILRDYERSNSLNLVIGASNEDDVNFQLFLYNGRFWYVPQDFEFPSNVERKRAWTLWTCGMKILSNDIRPFSLLKPRMLPGSLQKVVKNTWQPIMMLWRVSVVSTFQMMVEWLPYLFLRHIK